MPFGPARLPVTTPRTPLGATVDGASTTTRPTVGTEAPGRNVRDSPVSGEPDTDCVATARSVSTPRRILATRTWTPGGTFGITCLRRCRERTMRGPSSRAWRGKREPASQGSWRPGPGVEADADKGPAWPSRSSGALADATARPCAAPPVPARPSTAQAVSATSNTTRIERRRLNPPHSRRNPRTRATLPHKRGRYWGELARRVHKPGFWLMPPTRTRG